LCKKLVIFIIQDSAQAVKGKRFIKKFDKSGTNLYFTPGQNFAIIVSMFKMHEGTGKTQKRREKKKKGEPYG